MFGLGDAPLVATPALGRRIRNGRKPGAGALATCLGPTGPLALRLKRDCEIVAERGVQALEHRESPVVFLLRLGVRLHAVDGADGRGAGFADVLVVAGADGGEQGHAVGGAFVGGHRGDGFAEDVGLHLAPEGVLRAAAAGADLLHRDAEAFDEREAVAQGEGDAFHDRAHDVAAAVGEREADEGAAGVRVEVRRAFAGEVGEEVQALGAGGRGGGFLRRVRRSVTVALRAPVFADGRVEARPGTTAASRRPRG